MDIIFDKTPGEICDVFSSLWLINNFQYVKEEDYKLGLEFVHENMESTINSIINSKKMNTQKLEQYFSKDLSIIDIFGRGLLWEHKTLNEYLDHLRKIDSKDLETRIIRNLAKDDLSEDTIKSITSNKETIIDYIKELDIASSLKWEFFSMINYKESYIEEFIKFIEDYISLYKPIEKERTKLIKKFTDYLEQNITKSGIDFIEGITKNIVKLGNFEKIYITPVYIEDLTIHIKDKENICYIFLGVNFENAIKKLIGNDNLENSLNIFKNLSDKTRFQIIKLLLKKEYYGLEIARALNITTATVSYHMDFLLLTGIVHCEKKDHRAYYFLNKDTLRNTIQFLQNELDL